MQLKAKAPAKAKAANAAASAPEAVTPEAAPVIRAKPAALAASAGQFFARVLPEALPVFVEPKQAGHLRDRTFRGSATSSPASMLRAAATLAAIARYHGTTLHAIATGEAVTLSLYRAGEAYAMQSGAASDTVNRLATQADTEANALRITPEAAKRAIAYLPQALRAEA